VPTVSELTLKVKVDPRELQRLAKEFQDVGKTAERAAGKALPAFRRLEGNLKRLAAPLKRITGLFLNWKTAIAGVAGAAGLGMFTRALINAGREAETFITQLGVLFGTTEKQTKELFRAIREFAAPLPVTTREIVDAFVKLKSVNLKPTEEALKAIVSASLATGKSMQEITLAIQSINQISLRRFGIELRRTGDTATLAFGNVRVEVANTDKAIRKGLLDLFGKAFPDSIERASKDLDTATATMKSLLGDLLTEGGQPLTRELASIVNEINEWIKANKELLQQKIVAFAEQVAEGFRLIFEMGKSVVGLFRSELPGEISRIDTAFLALGETLLLTLKAMREVVEFRLKLAKIPRSVRAALGDIPALFEDQSATKSLEKDLANLDSRITSLSKALDNMAKGAVQRAIGGVSNLADTSKGLNDVLDTVGGNAGSAGEGIKDLDENTKNLNKSLEKQIEKLKFQVETFGLSEEAIIKHRAAVLIEQGADAKLVKQLEALELKLLKQKKARDELNKKLEATIKRRKEEHKGLQELKRQYEDIRRDALPESVRLMEELSERLTAINKAAAELPEIAAQAEETRRLVIAKFEKEITEALRREQIERLKATGDFTDAVKAAWLQLQDAAGSAFEATSQFFTDAFNEMRNTLADFVDNVIRGKFDSIKDLWKGLLASMSRIFSQFVAAIATQTIVLNIAPNLAGSLGISGGSNILGSILSPILSPLRSIGSSFIAGLTTNPFGAAGILGSGTTFMPFGATPTPPGLPSIPTVPGLPSPGPTPPPSGLGFNVGQILLLGAPLIGGGLGFLTGGVPGLIQGGLSGLGVLGGSILASSLGLGTLGGFVLGGIGGIVGGLLGGLLGSLFEKKPQIDIEIPKFGGNEREYQKALQEGLTVKVQDFIDAQMDEALAKSLIWIKTRKIDDVNDQIRKQVLDAISGTINQVFRFIDKLPAEMQPRLREVLRNTELRLAQTEDDFLLEFDEKSKDVNKLFKKLEQFLGGELQGRFLFAIRDFFTETLKSIGVLPEKAQELVEGKFQEFLKIKGREARAQAGQAFFDLVNAYVDVFNLINDNFGDAIREQISQIRALADELGFTGIPTFEQFKASLQTLIQEAELDPQIVEKYKALRQAILSTIDAITSSISGLVSSIGSLNATIVSLGGDAVDTTGATQQVVDTLRSLLQSGGLSLSEREGLLGQLASFANQLLAQEQARAQAELESRRQGLQQRIDALTREKELIQENFRARIEALQEELRAAEAFKSLSESIRGDLEGILFSPSAPLTGGEQMGMLQALIAAAQGGTTPEAIDRLRGLLTRGFELATRAFGVGSPEQQAVFTQVTTQLQDLQKLTEEKGARAEEIQAQIEALNEQQAAALKSIDATIQSVQSQMSDQVALSADVAENLRGLFEFIRDQELQILQERLNQLAEVTNVQGDAQLQALGTINNTLQQIKQLIEQGKVVPIGPPGQPSFGGGDFPVLRRFAHGGVITEPTLAVGLRSGRRTLMGEAGPEYVVPARGGAGAVTVTIGDIVVQGAADPEATAREVERRILDSVRRGRLARELRRVA